MNKKWSWKKISAIGASAMLAFSLTFGLVFSDLSPNGGLDSAENGITDSIEGGGTDREASSYAMTVTYPNGAADLGRFPDGYSYTFTDKTKVDNYRARKIASDLTTVKVVSSQAAGSQQNPYVIATTTDWENFVRKMGTSANAYGLNKFFVLAEDLDFKGATFHHVDYFRGTFYGLGHSIQNATISTWQYFNGSSYASLANSTHGYGVFGQIVDATITDLLVENYSWQNMPALLTGSANGDVGGRTCRTGGVVGASSGTDFVLNCHANGQISSPITYTGYHVTGGVVGYRMDDTGKTIVMYRCSAELNATTGDRPIVGGLIGDIIDHTTAHVFDCAANVYNNTATVNNENFCGVLSGYTWSATLVVENIIGSAFMKSSTGIYAGGIIGVGNPVAVTAKNCYGYATAAGKPVYAIVGNNAAFTGSAYNIVNLNTVKDPAVAYAALRPTSRDELTNFASQVHNYNTPALLTAATVAAVGEASSFPLYSGIWDKTKIGGTYTPANSPVRNYLNAIVTFADQDEGPIQLKDSENPVIYATTEVGAKLPTPATNPAGKSFAGWSLDKTSDAKVLTEFPKDVYGAVTMYPVWNMTGVTVTTDANFEENTDGEKTTTGERGVTAKYIGGKAVVTIEASVSLPSGAGINDGDYEVTWSWYKDGTPIAGETKDTLVLTERTKGAYTARASVKHKTQLWRTDTASESTAWKITIGKGRLTQGAITLAEQDENGTDVFAYWGQPVSELTKYVVTTMTNTAGDAIPGSVDWGEGAATKVGSVQGNYSATFVPDDKENYDNTPISVTISPTILQLKFEFTLAEIPQVFTYNVEYGTVYKGKDLAAKFEESYFALLDEYYAKNKDAHDAMVGNMPYFPTSIPAAGYVSIETYRGTQGEEVRALFDATGIGYDNYIVKNKTDNSAVLTMPLQFKKEPQAFTVSHFGYVQTPGTIMTDPYVVNLGYGALVTKPAIDSVQQVGSKTMFLVGWFKSNSAGDVSENSVAWGFENDRISTNTYIAGYWKEGYLKLESIDSVALNGVGSFTARSMPRSVDYIVMGVYAVCENEGSAPTPSSERISIRLSPDDYTVKGSGDGAYHIQRDTTGYDTGTNERITVSAKAFSGSTLTKTIDVKVNKKYIDLSGINFPPISKEANPDRPQTYDPVTDFDFLDEQGVVSNDFDISQITYAYTTIDGSSVNPEDLTRVGTYYVTLTINWKTADFESDPVSTTFTLTEKAKAVMVEWYRTDEVEWNSADGTTFTFNGQHQQPQARFYLYTEDETAEKSYITILFDYTGNGGDVNVAVGVGNYTVGVTLRNSRYVLHKDAVAEAKFNIKKAQVRLPELANDTREYQKGGWDLSGQLGYTAEQLEFLVKVSGAQQENVKSDYMILVELRDKANSEWENGGNGTVSIPWKITHKVLTIPTFTETLVYNGEEIYNIADYANYFDGEVMEFFGNEGQIMASNADTYRAQLRLKDTKNYVWEGEFDGVVVWQIQKKELYLSWGEWKYLQGSTMYAPRPTAAYGLAEVDEEHFANNISSQLLYSGDTEKREAGSYRIEVSIAQTSELFRNYQLAQESRNFYWVIKAEASEVVITVVWNLPADGGFSYNGNIQAPTVRALYSENGMGEENLDDYIISYTGDYDKSKWAGQYNVTAVITAVNGTQLRLREGQISYVIRTSNGEGRPPVEPEEPDQPIDPPSENTIGAIPQMIISGVSLVLILVFTIMTLNYASVAKNARRKAKKLAQMTYSFSPLGLLALGLFGLTEMNWWIIAGALMGVALFMAIMMFVFRGKSKKALLMLEEEQDRIEEEKEMARMDREAQMREEQQRRDNEFKMMFAAMQQNYQQPQMQYDDMRSLLAETVTALLPGLQQQQAALPPAQSENDELRAQVAQQQEMINQLMQQQAAAAQAPASGYAEPAANYYEEDDGASVFGNDGESVSLEELYGKLSDDAKRLYYEIGGYIMSKPETMQNDGKYAVLFKYRGKTLFKLCIKNDMPVLYYALGNGSKSEVPISDPSALEMAKNIVDLRMSQSER